ncbi:coiled-coil domain-containing protein 15 isoform X2 [Molossus molossus]|uniref:coiled-coil domain-containing protein 15 isoform X2 n=1 Tax=Molossus molossus TaxID=27622 RepID=UPI001747B22D|nr:coiled-coil domain-containing protein 15 isoform X2 [Molossus molossus]
MPASMAPLKKRRNTARLPLALNPLKSKDVLAVLAERNQAVVPVGAWVEPASALSPEIPASTSAYMIEEELKEQLRKKQEALKRFQRQVKHRVNQQIRLRKKQQLQKSYEAAEKEGTIAMKSSDPAHLTPKITSVFQNNLNAAIGSATLPPSQMLGDGIEDRENQNQLFQQAQALSQIMKQARHQLASFKTVSKKDESVFPDDTRKSFPTQEEPDSEESLSLMMDKKRKENLFWCNQQDLLSEKKDTFFSRVRKVQFKNPLFAIMEEDELTKLHLQDILPETQDYFPEAQGDILETQEQNTLPKCQDQDFLPRYQKVRFKEPYSDTIHEKGRGDFSLACYQSPTPKLQDQNTFFKQPSSFIREESLRDELPLECQCYVNLQVQDQASPGDQSLYSRQQLSVGTAERWQDLFPDGHQYLPPKHRREASSRRQVHDRYQSGLNTEFQTPLALQFGVDQEEDKKERQKRYLRYRRLFMSIEREQVKEQQKQKEHRKRIEKIKKKKEQQRYAEEQRIIRMNFHEEPYSSEKVSEMLAQLQLEEVKGPREKQQQREKEYQRYVEALRAQIQEKMQLYNITLPPLCCCGPDFWDAHPDTCANNCIFYKNHRAYTRALYSVINSCDIPEGNSTLRVAIHNFASAHRRTLKNE